MIGQPALFAAPERPDLPPVGALVLDCDRERFGRPPSQLYIVDRHGCPWRDGPCPHGRYAVTIRAGVSAYCADGRHLQVVE